jgi:hypothetical protein
MSDTRPTDPGAAVAEIYEDLQRRRLSGEIPADLEDELGAAFARVAPEAALGGDVDVLLDQAEESASIDPHVPVDGGGPAAVAVRRLLRKAMYWYMAFVTRQVGQFAGSLSRATRLMETRLRALEAGERATPLVDAERARLEPGHADASELAAIRDALAGCSGPVLLTDAGRDDLAAQLRGVGDIVGVDEDPRSVVRCRAAGVATVLAGPVEHLRSLAPGSVGAVVLRGIVERSDPEACLVLADLCSRAVVPSGRLVVVSPDPAAWSRGEVSIDADLAGCRPLSAATWAHLLRTRGFDDVATVECGATYCVVGRRAS